MKLNDVQIRQAKPQGHPFQMTDGKGMYLLVQPSGSKLWRYRFRIGGKQKQYAIGKYPEVTLSQARAELAKARALVKQGIDPVHERRRNKEKQHQELNNTLQLVAGQWLERKSRERTETYVKQISDGFERHIYPAIGNRPIGSITSGDILETLERVQHHAPSTACMLRQWLTAVFEFATVRRLVEVDPAWAVRGEFKRPPSQKKQPLKPDELPEFFERLTEYEKSPQVSTATVIALRLLLLTFVRTTELRLAEWSEFDFDGSAWRIPAHRMKMRRRHIVPLSEQSAVQLQKLRDKGRSGELLFTNRRSPNQPMNKGTINAALRNMGYAGRLSAHAFRNTASTILHERGYESDHIEMQLAHVDRSVRGRYNSADYLEQRRLLMQDWADFLTEAGL